MGCLEYLNTYGPNRTKISLRSRIIVFLKFIYPNEPNTKNVEECANRYFSENRDYKKDVEQFLISVKNYAPLTQRNYLMTIKGMLEENNHDLPTIVWKRFRRRIKGGTLTRVEIPTNVQLKQLLMNMPIPGRALFFTLATSGMRIGEALSLNDSDIDLKSSPVKIYIPGPITKTKESRITFVTQEAKGFIDEWQKVRKKNDRLFSFSGEEAGTFWVNACKQSGLDQKDTASGRMIYHPHCLRKYFRTMGGEINVDATEQLMGHKGYLTGEYRDIAESKLIDFYLRFEPNITIFSNTEEVNKLRQSEFDNKSMIGGLVVKNQELEKRLSDVDKILGEVLQSLEQLKAQT